MVVIWWQLHHSISLNTIYVDIGSQQGRRR
ncbi:hypothetical protein V6Z12_A05G200000 [Gossypium hirsutum]